MARYDVTVRVHTGWPASAADWFDLRQASRSLPRPLRLHRVLSLYIEGDTEVVLRTRGRQPRMAIHQARLTVPMLGLRRDRIRQIEVRRAHLLRRRRTVLDSWPQADTPTRSPGSPGTHQPATHASAA
jgi:hypothetical protein